MRVEYVATNCVQSPALCHRAASVERVERFLTVSLLKVDGRRDWPWQYHSYIESTNFLIHVYTLHVSGLLCELTQGIQEQKFMQMNGSNVLHST